MPDPNSVATSHSSAVGRIAPEWMLVATTVFWGLSFPLMKDWIEAGKQREIGGAIANFTIIAVRMAVALTVLALFRPGLFCNPRGREHRAGLILGALTFAGAAFQGLGLAWTTPTSSAFITSLSSVWVPLFAWLWFRIPLSRWTLAALALGMAGTLVLSMASMEEVHWGYGESLTIVCTLLFAVQILLLDRLGRGLNSAHFSTAFFATYGAGALITAASLAVTGPGLSTWVSCTRQMLEDPALFRSMVALSIFCTVLTFHWMNVYQPRITASHAAIIYLLEPVFTAIFSLYWGHDRLTYHLLIGATLILAGNLVVELPRWIRQSPRASQSNDIP
jgi:drug/metabolite transporter (DMT)-like permease